MIYRPKDDPADCSPANDTVLADESLARIRLGLIALSDAALTESLSQPMRLLLRRLDDAERVSPSPPAVSDGD